MRRLSLILAFAIAVAACGGDGAEVTSTTAVADVDTTSTRPAEDPTTTTAAPPSTTAAPATTTSAAAAGGGGESCIAGTWELDNDAFLENMIEVFADADFGDAQVSMLEGGVFSVELGADGSLSSTREDWGFAVATPDGDVQIVINGTESGTWSADGTTMTVDIDESDLTSDTKIVVDGQEVPLPGGAPVDVPEGFATQSEYTCSGDTLTLTNAGVVSVLNRT